MLLAKISCTQHSNFQHCPFDFLQKYVPRTLFIRVDSQHINRHLLFTLIEEQYGGFLSS